MLGCTSSGSSDGSSGSSSGSTGSSSSSNSGGLRRTREYHKINKSIPNLAGVRRQLGTYIMDRLKRSVFVFEILVTPRLCINKGGRRHALLTSAAGDTEALIIDSSVIIVSSVHGGWGVS